MFDPFVKQAYKAGHAVDPLVNALSLLPKGTLTKLAFGHMSCGGDSADWLERFQGTPLYDQALELLQEELHQETEDLQNREQQHAFHSAGDQLRLKKKLLELELARQDMSGAMPPTANPGPMPPDVPTAAFPGAMGAATQNSIQPPEGAPPKTAAVDPEVLAAMQAEQEVSGETPPAMQRLGNWFGRHQPGVGAALGAARGALYGSTLGIGSGKGPIVPRPGLGMLLGAGLGAGAGYLGGQFTQGLTQGHVGGATPYPGGGMVPDQFKGASAEAQWAQAMVEMEEKEASARFAGALEKLAFGAAAGKGVGSALWNMASKNPGLAVGGGLGMIHGGMTGAQQTIDPMTGQPTGGGVTGALKGAIGEGVLGAGAGLAVQGLGRSVAGAYGTRAKEMARAAKLPKRQAAKFEPTSYVDLMRKQIGQRSSAFAKDVGQVGEGLSNTATAMGRDSRRFGRPPVPTP
jgi:hypothetical protein